MQTLYRRPLPTDAIAFSCAEGRQIFAEALAAGGLEGYFPLAEQLGSVEELTRLAPVLEPLTAHVQLRTPQAEPHAQALELARAELRRLPVYAPLSAALGSERAELASLLLCALAEQLPLPLRAAVQPEGEALLRELHNLRAQVAAIAGLAR